MDKKFGLYIVLGMIVGAVLGASFGPAIGNSALGVFGGGVDQPFWGNRVKSLGIGLEPIRVTRLNPERLTEAIQNAVTDIKMRKRADGIGKAIRAEDGIGNAVKIVKKYLGA